MQSSGFTSHLSPQIAIGKVIQQKTFPMRLGPFSGSVITMRAGHHLGTKGITMSPVSSQISGQPITRQIGIVNWDKGIFYFSHLCLSVTSSVLCVSAPWWLKDLAVFNLPVCGQVFFYPLTRVWFVGRLGGPRSALSSGPGPGTLYVAVTCQVSKSVIVIPSPGHFPRMPFHPALL